MTKAAFQAPEFNDEDKAREALEALRWPDGPYCPHCGNSDQTKIAKVEGKKQSHRPGLYYCNECKGQFTVTVGTVFERSKVPLTKWWLAAHLLNSSKKGMSAHQLHRVLGVTYKTAWFMAHRLREAMADLNPGPLGGHGKVIEADTTYIGGKEANKHRNKRDRRRSAAWASRSCTPWLSAKAAPLASYCERYRQDPAPHPDRKRLAQIVAHD